MARLVLVTPHASTRPSNVSANESCEPQTTLHIRMSLSSKGRTDWGDSPETQSDSPSWPTPSSF